MRIKKLLSLGLATAMAAGVFTAAGINLQLQPAASDTGDDWLHAVGSRLYDMNGNEVWLTGANWFGLNCSERCPHYLWSADCDDLLREVADRGINVIRFPISSECLIEWMRGEPKQLTGGGMQAAYNPPTDMDDGNGGIVKAGTYGSINKEFVEADGKTYIDTERAFDIILGKCKKYGIKAFLDVHSPHADNSGHVYNLWYGKEMADGTMVTTQLWIDSLVWAAEKYKNDDTLLGFDLQNEPHGKGQEGSVAAKWDDSTDENNWAYAATQCANAILEVNPHALIFIEGVEQTLSGAMAGDYWGMPDRQTNSPYIPAWWGGNLRGVRDYPIQLNGSGNSQIVYSPHDYGPSVYDQTWFAKDFTTQTLLDDYWYDTWAYINQEEIAPLLIGEWGGHMDGAKNQKWMELLRDYMINNHINHTFWCLNTNSGDTGGLWSSFSYSINNVSDTSNGTTIFWEEDKYALFEKSLWQTLETGKYIGLDHQIPLGINGTGLTLNEFYADYAATEGSNLDGGTVLSQSGSIVTPSQTTTTESTPLDLNYGDINEDGKVSINDVIVYNRYIAEDTTVTVTAKGLENAEVTGDTVVNSDDAVKVLRYLASFITYEELAP